MRQITIGSVTSLSAERGAGFAVRLLVAAGTLALATGLVTAPA